MAVSEERYFVNPYNDYDPSRNAKIEINAQFWKDYITETFFECIMKLKPKNSEKYCAGGIYTGNIGLIWTSFKLLNSNLWSNDQSFIQQIKKYVTSCLKANEEYYGSASLKNTHDVSFLVGKAGFYFMSIFASKILENNQGIEKYKREYSKLSPILEPINFLPKGSDELFVGEKIFLLLNKNKIIILYFF